MNAPLSSRIVLSVLSLTFLAGACGESGSPQAPEPYVPFVNPLPVSSSPGTEFNAFQDLIREKEGVYSIHHIEVVIRMTDPKDDYFHVEMPLDDSWRALDPPHHWDSEKIWRSRDRAVMTRSGQVSRDRKVEIETPEESSYPMYRYLEYSSLRMPDFIQKHPNGTYEMKALVSLDAPTFSKDTPKEYWWGSFRLDKREAKVMAGSLRDSLQLANPSTVIHEARMFRLSDSEFEIRSFADTCVDEDIEVYTVARYRRRQ